VIDYNNATDGDIMIAYALLQARDAWQTGEYRDEALKIISDIRTRLGVVRQGRTYLLPGYFGFNKEGSVVLNPSYLILPAFRMFSREDQAAFWNKIHQDGLFLIDRSCFGSLCLPSDWVMVEGDRFTPAPGKDAYFGGNAIRILLNISLDDAQRYPAGVSALLDRYRLTGHLPLWIDLEKDSVSLRPASAGHFAIFSLAAEKLGHKPLARRLLDEANKKIKTEMHAYYSFSLYLLATTGSRPIGI
jgi:endo-1,4-beta-D-glucanase Y